MVPADAHGCPACPHSAVGPAIAGSPNVLTNGLPSVRVGDSGVHAACCGPNKWNAKTGSRSVLINGRSAHRLADLVRHCGGIGQTSAGSPNVIVGDTNYGSVENRSKKKSWVSINMLDALGNAVPHLDYVITLPDGRTVTGKLDQNGQAHIENIDPGDCMVQFPDLEFLDHIST